MEVLLAGSILQRRESLLTIYIVDRRRQGQWLKTLNRLLQPMHK